MTKTNDGANAIDRGKQSAAEPSGGVADHGDGVDHRPWCDLTESDGIQELCAGHPVVGDDGVVLHERDDDEAATIGEGADLERDPGQGAEPPTATACAATAPSKAPEPKLTTVCPCRRMSDLRQSARRGARAPGTGRRLLRCAPPSRA